MSQSRNSDLLRPLLIAGPAADASALAVRRILHAKRRDQGLLVIDYQGTLARQLTPATRGNLHRAPVMWCDLTNRQRPLGMFRLGRSPGMRTAFNAFLANVSDGLRLPLARTTIESVASLAWRLTEHGTVGLAAVANCLKRPEFGQPLARSGAGDEVQKVIELLNWTLRYPSVWALSEGNNKVDVARALRQGGTVWLEIMAAHMERLEHRIVCQMVDAMVLDHLLSVAEDRADTSRHATAAPPVVLHGFPAIPPGSVAIPSLPARHVGVFKLTASQPLVRTAMPWIDAKADCWLAGPLGNMRTASKFDWLTDDERTRLSRLQPGEVWVRAGISGKSLVATVKRAPPVEVLADVSRSEAEYRLRLATAKQFSTAHSVELAPPANTDLYGRLHATESLLAGWLRVKAHNRYSHGHDRVTIEQFGANLDIEIAQLAAELRDGRYRSRPLRTVRIPKQDGGERLLRIACVRDRVAQSACLHLLEPLFEPRFSTRSFAYRPGRNAHQALAFARSAIRAGKHWVVTADIRRCFDSIDHDILLGLIGEVVGDRDLLALIQRWLTADVIDFMDIFPAELGVSQGESISPLMANIYLDLMDKEFERTGVTFARYADDYLLLCETETEAAAGLQQMKEFLGDALHLSLKPAKTQYGHIGAGATFLGFELRGLDVVIPAEKIELAARAAIEQVETLGNKGMPVEKRWRAAETFNMLVRGFRNYFGIDDAPLIREQLAALDRRVGDVASRSVGSDPALELIWLAREMFVGVLPATSEDTQLKVEAITSGYPEVVAPRASRTAFGTTEPSPPISASAGRPPQDEASDQQLLLCDGNVHVMRSGSYVTMQGEHLVVKHRKAEVRRVPLAEIVTVYLEGKGIAVSADLTMELCAREVPVIFTPLFGKPAAIAQPVTTLRSSLRQQQVLRRNEPDVVRTGLRMLAAKIANQASLIKYFERYRKRRGDVLSADLACAADQIRDAAAALEQIDPSSAGARNTAMGWEGKAAAQYWSCFSRLLPSGVSFPGRHTYRATDPVNAAINYVYGILYGEVWRAVVRGGLDPYFGILHGSERDHGSLVFDLIEEYRAPMADRVVLGMLGRGFELEMDADGRLRTRCRRKLALAFHKLWQRSIQWRGSSWSAAQIVDAQIASIREMYTGKGSYLPFRFRW